MTISEKHFVDLAPARIALYDNFMSTPRVIEVDQAEVLPYLDSLTTQTYTLAKEMGGKLPYSVIRELCENFIHAGFSEITISVYDNGNTICFSDQGPGISNKSAALEPGITSASQTMKQFIRGVGSGLPISREYMAAQGGLLEIHDNINAGCIVLISLLTERASHNERAEAAQTSMSSAGAESSLSATMPSLTNSTPDFLHQYDVEPLTPRGVHYSKASSPENAASFLSAREAEALKIIEINGIVGPTTLSKLLKTSSPTAFRLLRTLEEKGLVLCAPNKKRLLTQSGLTLLSKMR